MTVLPVTTRPVNVRYHTAKRLSRARVHFVTARASLFTDQRMSSPSLKAKKKKNFKTMCEHTLDSSPTVSGECSRPSNPRSVARSGP